VCVCVCACVRACVCVCVCVCVRIGGGSQQRQHGPFVSSPGETAPAKDHADWEPADLFTCASTMSSSGEPEPTPAVPCCLRSPKFAPKLVCDSSSSVLASRTFPRTYTIWICERLLCALGRGTFDGSHQMLLQLASNHGGSQELCCCAPVSLTGCRWAL